LALIPLVTEPLLSTQNTSQMGRAAPPSISPRSSNHLSNAGFLSVLLSLPAVYDEQGASMGNYDGFRLIEEAHP